MSEICTHDCSITGPSFWSVLATLNLTLATLSVAIPNTVGSMSLVVTSVPQASASTYSKHTGYYLVGLSGNLNKISNTF